jgi:hypothetical protein
MARPSAWVIGRVLRRDEIASLNETERKTPVLRGFTVEHVFDSLPRDSGKQVETRG